MKWISFILGLLFLSFNFQKDNNIIKWSQNRKLQWEDYMGTPDIKSEHAAVTYCKMPCRSFSKKDTMYIVINAVVDRNKSWVKSEKKRNNLLIHERIHFDYCELFARKIRKKLSSLSPSKKEDVKAQLKQLVDQNFDSLKVAQRKYDIETDFSINASVQKEWEKSISQQLEEYKAYSDSVVKIVLIK